jgi:hypothetical protein
MTSGENPRERLAATRKAIERDTHELRARIYGIRARGLAAISSMDEIGQMMSAIAGRRRPAGTPISRNGQKS